jgi:parvulin-like peptidyl-prolyl isomerase
MMPWKRTVVIVLAVAAASCSKKSEEAPAAEEKWPAHGLTEAQANEVLAKVGDRTITVGEFADRLASQSPYLRARFEGPERRKEFLDNFVRFELLVYEAKRRGYADTPEMTRARRNAMIQQLVTQEVDEPLEGTAITDEEIQAVYDGNPTEFDREAQVRASHIFIKDRARASKVLARATAGDLASFRKLARDESEDEQTKGNSGDLQFFKADAEQPPAAIRDAAFSLDKVGAVYPKLIEEGGGYHIVMLTGKRAELKRTYEQAKRAIRHRLTRERKDAAMEALTKRLRDEIEVEVDYDALKDIEVDIPDLPQGP